MASEVDKRRKCFTFIWKAENADYAGAILRSPAFTVNEMDETNWQLELYLPFFSKYSNSALHLLRLEDNNGTANVKIDCELAFLALDGTVLHIFEKKKSVIEKYERIGSDEFPSHYEVFFARRSVFLSQDTLTVRCRMWKSDGEFSKDVQCFARTRIAVEKRSFLWNLRNFSALNTDTKKTYKIGSLRNGEQLLSLELFLTGRQNCDETLRLKIIPINRNIKVSTLQLSIVDASKSTVNCLLCEFFPRDSLEWKEFTLFYTKNELMEKKSAYLPNDVLSLLCECSFCFGNLVGEIVGDISNCPAIENPEPDKANAPHPPKSILINDLKSMLNNSSFSDVKLKTGSKTYPAHKLILGFRSPVFKAMFSKDMKENINDCVDIEDLSDETVFHMLRYIYSAEVGELEWDRATELYEAADKYEILNLKDICSYFLKTNVHPTNACKALVLADMHEDDDLKRFVQDFILRHGEDIINSEEWEKLMEINLKLAAETMRLKYQKLPK